MSYMQKIVRFKNEMFIKTVRQHKSLPSNCTAVVYCVYCVWVSSVSSLLYPFLSAFYQLAACNLISSNGSSWRDTGYIVARTTISSVRSWYIRKLHSNWKPLYNVHFAEMFFSSFGHKTLWFTQIVDLAWPLCVISGNALTCWIGSHPASYSQTDTNTVFSVKSCWVFDCAHSLYNCLYEVLTLESQCCGSFQLSLNIQNTDHRPWIQDQSWSLWQTCDQFCVVIQLDSLTVTTCISLAQSNALL